MEGAVTTEEFEQTLEAGSPPEGLTVPLEALWWDSKGEWAKAHSLVDELETLDGMAVHAYLHRKEGQQSNADYWYRLAGKQFHRPTLEEEWSALLSGLLNK